MDISLFMSAARPKWWKRMYESLEKTQFGWEIIAVGPNPPLVKMPDNFRYIKCDYKPCQCYAIASAHCRGEVMGWTCDDAVYAPDALDIIMSSYYASDWLAIFTQSTIENGKDVTEEHNFFRHCKDSPVMAPMAFMSKKLFWKTGGYERQYISGQAENSILMDAYSLGGYIKHLQDSKVSINHEEVHGGFLNKIKYRLGKNSFRTGYYSDRRYLEECWVKEGFGTYDEKTLKHGTVSPVRLLAHQPFNYDNILTVAQGPQGRWGNI